MVSPNQGIAMAGPRAPTFASSPILIVADATLYDRARMIAELAVGSEQCDDAIIRHAYRRWGPACFAHLNGDFAVALWDGEREVLVLARDIAGLRPLHLKWRVDGVDFASMPQPLATANGARAAPDLDRWLRYHTLLPQTGPASFFDGIERVEPGETLVISRSSVERLRSWIAPQADHRIDFQSAVRAMRSTIDLAVADRIAGITGPLSAQLSAGMDSSAVVASAASLTDAPIHAFTGVPAAGSPAELPPNYFADESQIAAATAGLYPNVIHHRVQSSLEPTLAYADRWGDLSGQPFRSYGNFGWIEATLFGAAQCGSREILSGNFGNISFSYDGFAAIPEALCAGQLRRWARLTAGAKREPGVRWRGALARSLPAFLSPVRLAALMGLLGKEREVDGFADTFLNPRHPMIRALRDEAQHVPMLSAATRSGHDARVPLMHWIDNGCFNHGARLYTGIEQRDPTADRRVIDLSFTLPTHLFIDNGRPRSLAIEVLNGRVAPEVLTPVKGVQGQDWHLSFAQSVGEMRQEVARLRDHRRLAELLDLDAIDLSLDDWQRDPSAARGDFVRFELISRAVCGARWARRLLDGESRHG